MFYNIFFAFACLGIASAVNVALPNGSGGKYCIILNSNITGKLEYIDNNVIYLKENQM